MKNRYKPRNSINGIGIVNAKTELILLLFRDKIPERLTVLETNTSTAYPTLYLLQ